MRTGEPSTATLARPAAGVGGEDLARVRHLLVEGIAAAVVDLPAGAPIEVTLTTIRRARSHPASVGADDAPFAWKPVFARRSLGLAAVQACLDGRFAAPAAAAGPLADRAVEEWRRSGWRTFHWEPWFAGLGPGARAVVLAEAVTWASSLWSAVDWTTVGAGAHFGGADDRWTSPTRRAVRLKGRHEARVDLVPDRHGPAAAWAPALVSMAPGRPGADVDEELAFLALVSALRSPAGEVPARVLGLWPEAGCRHTVDLDADMLHLAVKRVVSTVADITDARIRRGDPAPVETAGPAGA